jgi:hypothetical protein
MALIATSTLLAGGQPAYAQATGTVGGQVWCPTSFLPVYVSDAEVSVAGQTTTTAWNGIFTVEGVPHGAHQITFDPPPWVQCVETSIPITVPGSESRLFLLQPE